MTQSIHGHAAPIALTMGEPVGIGGEVTLKAWHALRATGPVFFVVDDPERLDRIAAMIGLETPIVSIRSPAEAMWCFPESLPVLALEHSVDARMGHPQPDTARAVLASIEAAVALVRSGDASAIVTNPIQKSVLYAVGFTFPGHTEFLGALTSVETDPVMMLASAELRVVPVTIHVALRDAVRHLTPELIIDRARTTAAALKIDFGIVNPRLAVLGLNPHAGEDGSMGSEDQTVVAPAIDALKRVGIAAFGPVSPDTAFTARARNTYDAAICMYHDQGLIPLKTLDMDGGVNITLGLPIVRTSPDHGTALDIAGKGIASPNSLIGAIRMAASMAARRKELTE